MRERRVDNPFVVGKYVSAQYFCDRENEVSMLKKHVENGRNVFFTAPRRMGKTGLICHFFGQPEIKEHYYTFFIDLYSTGSMRELVYNFGKAVIDNLRSRGDKMLESMMDFFKSVHLGVSFDPVTGSTGMDFGLGTIHEEQKTLDEIFQYLEKADKPCIVAFDEFQQISNYEEKNAEALLRTKIQHCKNTSFIYSGSKRHSIAQMFNSPSKPFYASSIAMNLSAIPIDTYREFAQKHFADNEKQLNDDTFNIIYNRYHGCTWYIQALLNELFAITKPGEVCDSEMIDTAISNVTSAQHVNYQFLMTFLATKQKVVLQAIAREGRVKQVNSSEFIQRHHLPSASSVQSALKGLLDKDIITRDDDGNYYVYDYFMGEWLAEK